MKSTNYTFRSWFWPRFMLINKQSGALRSSRPSTISI